MSETTTTTPTPDPQVCGVCLETPVPVQPLVPDDGTIAMSLFDAEWVTLKCKHHFHGACIHQWFVTCDTPASTHGRDCPNCRALTGRKRKWGAVTPSPPPPPLGSHIFSAADLARMRDAMNTITTLLPAAAAATAPRATTTLLNLPPSAEGIEGIGRSIRELMYTATTHWRADNSTTNEMDHIFSTAYDALDRDPGRRTYYPARTSAVQLIRYLYPFDMEAAPVSLPAPPQPLPTPSPAPPPQDPAVALQATFAALSCAVMDAYYAYIGAQGRFRSDAVPAAYARIRASTGTIYNTDIDTAITCVQAYIAALIHDGCLPTGTLRTSAASLLEFLQSPAVQRHPRGHPAPPPPTRLFIFGVVCTAYLNIPMQHRNDSIVEAFDLMYNSVYDDSSTLANTIQNVNAYIAALMIAAFLASHPARSSAINLLRFLQAEQEQETVQRVAAAADSLPLDTTRMEDVD